MNRYHYNLGKSVFICSSAILGLWLGANTTTNNVQAETTTEEPTSQQISKATQTSTSNLNQADKEESKALPTAQTATPVTQTENQTNSTEDKPETKVIVHYQGDGDTGNLIFGELILVVMVKNMNGPVRIHMVNMLQLL